MDMKNCADRTFLSTTSLSSPEAGCRENRDLVEEWLLRFAVNSSQPLNDGLLSLWRDEFSEFEPDVLETAFREVLHEHVFSNFPTVGEIYGKACDLRDAKRQRLDRRLAAEARAAHERLLSNQPSSEELHRRQERYCEEMGEWGRELLKIQRKTQPKIQAEPVVVIAWPEVVAKLKEEGRQMVAKYPGSAAPQEL
jgi:hypothetical protein